MKNRKFVLGLIICISLSFGGVMLYMNYTLNAMLEQNAESKEELEDAVYSEDGFSDPLAELEDDKTTSDIRTLKESEFKELQGLKECPDSHMDIYRVDVESFLDGAIDNWQPGDWQKNDDHYYVVDYTDGTSSYRRELWYYSNLDKSGWCEVRIGLDAVSERVHNINLMLPFVDNSKKAFTDILVWLEIEPEDAKEIFDKMLVAIHELGENERIEYEANGYVFYLAEFDYDDFEHMRKDKSYAVSISISETEE